MDIWLRATTTEEILSKLASIPAYVTILRLAKTDLNNKTAADLVQIFAAIPANITSLYLGANNLYQISVADLVQTFAAIPANVTSLDLDLNQLNKKTVPELVQIFAAIPANVTSLGLGANDLPLKGLSKMVEIFAAIPANVTSLDLGREFFRLPTDQLQQMAVAIPASITNLHLGTSDFLFRDINRLVQFLTFIRSNVTSLHFGKTKLSTGQLVKVFAAIPFNVTSLDLGENSLWDKSSDSLAKVFGAIPSNVTSLDLNENNDRRFITVAEKVRVLAAIPHSITSLTLGRDDLEFYTAAQEIQIVSAIPPNVTNLDLNKHRRNNLRITDILLKLPGSISIVTVNGKSATPVEHLLDIVFPNAIRSDFFNSPYLDPIQPNFTIDNALLIEIINYLQRHHSPMGCLVTAMLLDGKIATTCTETQAQDTESMTKRALAAISFYCKAACNSTLKPHIEYLLWHERVTTDNPAVQQALSQYRLSPERLAAGLGFFRGAAELEQHDLLELADHTVAEMMSISSLAELINDLSDSSLNNAACHNHQK